MDGLCLKSRIHGVTPAIALDVRANASQVPQKAGPSPRFWFKIPLQTSWPGGGGTKITSITNNNNNNNRCNGMDVDDVVLIENREDIERGTVAQSDNNWVLKILQIRSLSKEDGPRNRTDGERENGHAGGVYNNGVNNEEEKEDKCDACRVNYTDDDEPTIEFNKDTFSKLLKKVSLAEAKIYAQLSYLGNIAYCIPKIKERNLLKYRGLRYVISSIDKRGLSIKTEVSCEDQGAEREISKEGIEVEKQKSNAHRISAAAAYQIAASAASYLHSQTKSILPFKSLKCEAGENSTEESNENHRMNSEVASLMATTDSVTAVVAAKEEVKQAVADDLNSSLSSPCEWFICDDDQGTRYVVIQGSESLASWQANLLFEPMKFEGLDVLVHRGIYEAAKGIYEQILPKVRAHLKSCRRRVTFRFTGHSLGGSLSTLINLMLLIRKEVPASSLLPVITFGAPSVMCGGDHLLRKLGLPRSHVQAITLHRDIVPRAFSCNYPDHVAELLKALNRNFRNHPCLNYQKLLYAPIGELLILQPDEELSPHHDLLPAGSGLYYLSCSVSNTNDAEKLLKVAQSVFLNTPHPLEILSDRSAYGSEGAILRDHDMGSYLKSVRRVIRQELIRIRKSKRDHRQKSWWSLLVVRGIDGGEVLIERHVGRVLQSGRESLERFGKLLASQKHMHLLVVLLFPARLLLLGAYRAIVHH